MVCLQAFLLSAMKMHCYVRALVRTASGPGVRGRSPGAAGDPRALLAAIYSSVTYMCRLVRKRMAAAGVRLGLPLRCPLAPAHVRWLGLAAFERVLSRKQAAYGGVLAVGGSTCCCMTKEVCGREQYQLPWVVGSTKLHRQYIRDLH